MLCNYEQYPASFVFLPFKHNYAFNVNNKLRKEILIVTIIYCRDIVNESLSLTDLSVREKKL